MQLPDTTALDSLHKEWPVIKAAPYSFVSSVVILCLVIGGIIYLLFRGRLERHKEQIGHLERDVARLSKEVPHKTDIAAKEQVAGQSKLVIHSAVYGTGPVDDMSVTERLRTAVKDALVVPVDNNLVPRDPAIGKTKRLAVEYSYGNPSIQQASRLEGERLVLPEDSEIQRLRGEIEQLTRKLINANVHAPIVNEVPADETIAQRVFAFCKELSIYMEERPARPDEDAIWNETKDNQQAFVHRYETEVLPWDRKLSAGYWKDFRERAVDLNNELELHDKHDEKLEEALRELDQPAQRTYVEAMRVAVERFRYLASMLN